MQNNTAEDCIMLVLNSEHRIVGFCMRMIDGNPMRFGPIGVKEEARNSGVGGILFDIMQLEMAKRGIYHLYFVSTDTPGRRFYERHGVKVFRTFVEYRKNI
jgi:ribosomal protein S18 acetylase RimI-like enzyme